MGAMLECVHTDTYTHTYIHTCMQTVCGSCEWAIVRLREVRQSAECAPDLGPQGAHRDRSKIT